MGVRFPLPAHSEKSPSRRFFVFRIYKMCRRFHTTAMTYSLTKPLFSWTQGSTPLFLHIPHSSVSIPDTARKEMVLEQNALEQEARWMADLWTDVLYLPSHQHYSTLISQVSRIVLDVERFEDDAQEEMAQFGMGAVYTKTSTGALLKQISVERKAACVEEIYRPYHAQLNRAARQITDQFGQCVLIDCHSFPSEPRYYEDQTPNRPDICLGTSERYTPQWMIDVLRTYFESQGLSVQLNTPFAGTILPNELIADAKYRNSIASIMIEVNRKLYMDEQTFEQSERFAEIRAIIQDALYTIEQHVEKDGAS